MSLLGLPAVLGNLGRIAGQLEAAAGDGLEDAAETVRQAWVENIESEGLVLTGHYRDSVSVERDGDEVGVVTDVDYARFLEFGTSDTEAHPVAEQAADESHDAVLGAVGDRVGRVL